MLTFQVEGCRLSFMNTTQNIDTAETESRIDLARRALAAGTLNKTMLEMLASLLREAISAMLAAEKKTGYGSFQARADQAAMVLKKVEAAAATAE